MRTFKLLLTVLMVSTVSVGFISCGDDSSGPDGPEIETTFNVEVKNVNMPKPVLKSGAVFSAGGPDDGPAIFPGETASFTFTAPPSTVPPLGGSGMHLNFVTMFVQSNDLFYAFPPGGLDLYDAQGNAVTGNVTEQLFLYDAGTEVNQEPGVGTDQKPNQSGPNTGADENGVITRIQDGEEGPGGFSYPDKSDVIEVTIEHDGNTQFTVNVTNVSDKETLQTSEGSKPVPLSPFAWAVHEDATNFALYQLNEPASRGIEWIAEDGFPASELGGNDLPPTEEEGLADVVGGMTGLIVPLSPPVYAVHEDGFQGFEEGQTASLGLEIVAEDGFPADMLGGMDLPPDMGLLDMLNAEDAVHMAGAAPNPNGNVPALEPGAGGDGEAIEFEITASPGDRLSVFSMFVQSNDLFYAFEPAGISLFDSNDNPISGDITEDLLLWDAGTEEDEEPGVGFNQKPRQGATALDVGTPENESVNRISNAPTNDFVYPATDQVIWITITPSSMQ
ncbi:spondin domain-containing protein [Fodinibius salsisoli]|uniref:Spondin domain-containing protein n=1 Tax=Fodinibius salsisoli TaxID=2820877 RepID=A0ABT3PNX2_9BACT|nr:spondin domain-containing protein [Fodinibius salsisoli]MCW9707542.1 spondin domain-containing protein [Fodinibius salsisoli]